jgi:hypothetical protein
MNKYLVVLCLSFAVSSHADEALTDTQTVIENRAKRAEFIKTNPDAKKADADLKSLLPDEASQEAAYGLSLEILQKLAAETGGDPEKIRELLMKIAADPKSIEKLLSKEQMEKVKALGHKAQNPESPGKTAAPSLKK